MKQFGFEKVIKKDWKRYVKKVNLAYVFLLFLCFLLFAIYANVSNLLF